MVKSADSGNQMDSADVVIVGGGVGGCSLGVKLASSGMRALSGSSSLKEERWG